MSNSPRLKILILSGPTGIGKTAIATLLANMLNGEIISCDSVQVYKELVIGANKDLQTSVPQHLINIVSWREKNFTNAEFNDLCCKTIEEISERGKVPLLVGGTGFYSKWIIEGRPCCPPPSREAMETVDKMVEGLSWEDAIKLLEDVDPEYAATLFKNDRYRLKRALSNWIQTHQPMRVFKTQALDEPERDFRCFYLSKDRQMLSLEIDARCEQMICTGLLREVAMLWLDGLDKDSPAGRAIGYADTLDLIGELWEAFKDNPQNRDGFFSQRWVAESFHKYLSKFKAASRQYSRRQDSWHKNSGFKWIDYREIAGRYPNDKHDLLGATASFIASMFRLSRKEWDESQELQQIHRDSLSARWTDDVRVAMRQYSKVLKTQHSLFRENETVARILADQLEPVFRTNLVNYFND